MHSVLSKALKSRSKLNTEVLYKNTFLNLSGENSRPTRKRVKNTPNSPNVSTCTIDFKKNKIKISAQQSTYNTNYKSTCKTNHFSLGFHRQFTCWSYNIRSSLSTFRVQTFSSITWLLLDNLVGQCSSPKMHMCIDLGKLACLLKINRLHFMHMLLKPQGMHSRIYFQLFY